MTRYTKTVKTAAADLLVDWRAFPVDSIMNAHDAWVLTDGALGTRGDFETMHRRIDLALAYAQVRHDAAKARRLAGRTV